MAQATGRRALAADVNPVAWLYSKVKLSPYRYEAGVNRRIGELLDLVTADDREAENDFQRLAWHQDVLAFLNSARRNLAWRTDGLDRTLMGFILVHLHAKLGNGISNQMRQSKAMAPDYSVRWWRERNLQPPKIDIRAYFRSRVAWRYRKDLPSKLSSSEVELGDSRDVLKRRRKFGAKLILTSPPYSGVTDYAYDNWIRLWMLGQACKPPGNTRARYCNKDDYTDLIEGTFREAQRLSDDDVTVYVRTDAREFTRAVTVKALSELWPSHVLACRFDKASGLTQTALFGNEWKKAGELDLLLLPAGRSSPEGFTVLRGP